MSETIGESLGVILALFEEDLSSDPDNVEMLNRVRTISEIYRNFTQNEFGDFQTQFERGYERSKQYIAYEKAPPTPELHLKDDPTPG